MQMQTQRLKPAREFVQQLEKDGQLGRKIAKECLWAMKANPDDPLY